VYEVRLTPPPLCPPVAPTLTENLPGQPQPLLIPALVAGIQQRRAGGAEDFRHNEYPSRRVDTRPLDPRDKPGEEGDWGGRASAVVSCAFIVEQEGNPLKLLPSGPQIAHDAGLLPEP